jgi:hypothetical protein
VTSKDNAGTSGSSNSGGGGGNIPAHASRHGRTSELDGVTLGPRSVSPGVSPSTKAALDDIAEISLDYSSRSERAVSASGEDKSSSEDHYNHHQYYQSHQQNRGVTGELKEPIPGAVVVTTVIKKESKPRGGVLEEMDVEDHYTAAGGPGRMRRPVSDAFMPTNRTEITAGPR